MTASIAYHQMKHKKEAINQIGRHNERTEEDDVSHSNENIDKARTKDNISLKQSSGSYVEDMQNIVESRTDKKIRKNAVVMVGHTFQIGEDALNVPEEKQVEILRKGYDFISERYGEDNVISATIHRDETNPHLHVDTVPMTEDGRLSARDVVTRQELRNVQSDMLQFMQEEYPELGFDRLNEDEREFENGKSQKDFEKLSKTKKEMDEERQNLDDREQKVKKGMINLENGQNALEASKKAFEDYKKQEEEKLNGREQQVKEQEQENASQKLKNSRVKIKQAKKSTELNKREKSLETSKNDFETYVDEKHEELTDMCDEYEEYFDKERRETNTELKERHESAKKKLKAVQNKRDEANKKAEEIKDFADDDLEDLKQPSKGMQQ